MVGSDQSLQREICQQQEAEQVKAGFDLYSASQYELNCEAEFKQFFWQDVGLLLIA